MTILVLCAACSRHVRTTEVSCPFCGTELAATPPREMPTTSADRLLARTAMTFTLAAAAATAVVACGKTQKTPEKEKEESVFQGDPAPAYGPPPVEPAAPDAAPEEASQRD